MAKKSNLSTIDHRLMMQADWQRDLPLTKIRKKCQWMVANVSKNLKSKSYNSMFLSLAALVIRHCATSTRSHLYKSSLSKRFVSATWSQRGFMCTVKWWLAGGLTPGLCATEDARKTRGAREKIRDLLWTKTCFYPLDQLNFKMKVKVSMNREQISLVLSMLSTCSWIGMSASAS